MVKTTHPFINWVNMMYEGVSPRKNLNWIPKARTNLKRAHKGNPRSRYTFYRELQNESKIDAFLEATCATSYAARISYTDAQTPAGSGESPSEGYRLLLENAGKNYPGSPQSRSEWI